MIDLGHRSLNKLTLINMIHSFSCENFYSFGELTTVNFVVNENAPQNNGYIQAPSGTRLSKVEAVIGPNASGKTNLLKVLPFLKWLIVDSFNVIPNFPVAVHPFAFDEHMNKPTKLSVVFEVNAFVYTYSFSMNQSKILFEELKLKNKTKEKITNKKIFARSWDEEAKRYQFTGKGFNLPKGFENLLRSNASVIGTAARLNHKTSQDIAKFWQEIETNVGEAGWVGDHLLPVSAAQLGEALNFFSENESLKKEAEKLLSRFDLGLEGFRITKQQNANGISMNVQAIHSFKGEEKFLPGLQYESSGTKQLFVLLKTILQVLGRGGIAILDEFDVSLHPEMVTTLFDLFANLETNPKNAQILFSTHSHMILNKLDKYQITLVEKNNDGLSESWRLDEMSGIRADENYHAKYIAGAYGALPKI